MTNSHNDRLTAMLYTQRDLQAKSFKHDFGTMSDEERMRYVRDNVLALTDELHEALGECGWRPWATSNHMHVSAYLGELVDAWHFLMNLMLASGIAPSVLADRLYDSYMEKQARNAQRQAEGYDGVSSKCPGCGRALDDVAVTCSQDKESAYCAQSDVTYQRQYFTN